MSTMQSQQAHAAHSGCDGLAGSLDRIQDDCEITRRLGVLALLRKHKRSQRQRSGVPAAAMMARSTNPLVIQRRDESAPFEDHAQCQHRLGEMKPESGRKDAKLMKEHASETR